MSKDYASSVFYDVDPAYVREQTDSVAESFAKHEKRIMEEIDEKEEENLRSKMRVWKDALTYIADPRHSNLRNQCYSWNSFGQDKPNEGYEELTKSVLQYCAGLPLALEALGSSLYGESVDVWESELAKWRTHLPEEIHSTLKIRLLREMGRKIICQDSPKEPGKCGRLCGKDAFNVLGEEIGTEKIEGLSLSSEDLPADPSLYNEGRPSKRICQGLISRLPFLSAFRELFSEPGEADFKTDAFSAMCNLRFLELNNVRLSGGYGKFP
ncbi:hypothetical protein NMG60_11036627 [Bertholletia excelsa]